MILQKLRLASFAVLVMFSTSQGVWATSFDEAINGDLSGNRLSPTHLTLSAGVHSVSAVTGAIDGEEVTFDQEYLRIDLPAGHKLVAINMTEYESPDGTAFIGVQTGETFSFDPEDARNNVASLLGWAHFGLNEGHDLGADILPSIGEAGRGAAGFTPPLIGPSFTFWIQQTGDPTSYQLDFVVAAVPEPAAWLLVSTAIGLLAVRRKR